MAMLCSDLCLYAFRHVLYLDLHMYMLMCQLSNVLPCLCASFHMFTCVLSCLCLDLHLHMFVCLDLCSACFMPSSMYLYSPFHVCVPRPRIRLSCHVLLQLFCRFIFLSCILAYWFKPDLDPMVFAIIHAPWRTSKDWITHFACLSCLSALCLFHILFASLLPLLVYQFLVFAFACTHMELGHSLPGVGKMGKETSMQIQAKWLGSVNIGVQPFPFGYVLFQTPSFLLPFSLRWFVLGISCHVPFVLISRVWRPLLFSCTQILGHALGMQAFTFPLCVLALCMMYVFIYLLVLSGVIIIVCVT